MKEKKKKKTDYGSLMTVTNIPTYWVPNSAMKEDKKIVLMTAQRSSAN